MQSTRPGRSPRPEKVEAVISAARKLFLTSGFNATTTDMVQQEAQVSKATLYNCYATKEALFAAVIQRECENFAARLFKISTQRSNLEDELQRLGEEYLAVLLQPQMLAFYRLILSEAARFPALAEMFYNSGPKETNNVFSECIGRYLPENAAFSQKQLASIFLSLLREDEFNHRLVIVNAKTSRQKLREVVSRAVSVIQHIMSR